MRRAIFFVFFSPNEQRGGEGGGGAARLFFFFFSPVQQTTSGIGHRVKSFFRVSNQCAECEKQQQHNNNRYDVCDLSVAGAGAEETNSAVCMLYRLYQSVRLR